MAKPTYYLWKADYQTEEEYLTVKERFIRYGFRVVTYIDGSTDKDINEGIKALIKNHYNDSAY